MLTACCAHCSKLTCTATFDISDSWAVSGGYATSVNVFVQNKGSNTVNIPYYATVSSSNYKSLQQARPTSSSTKNAIIQPAGMICSRL